MAGNKNSGRKSWRDEMLQNEVINLSWKIIATALHDKTATMDEKKMIALEVVKKTCPREINLKGEALATHVYNVIGRIQQDISADRRPSLALDYGNGLDERRTRQGDAI